MAQKICTACGYEGKGHPGQRGSGTAFRVLGVLLMLPIYTLWRIFSGRSGKMCANCGLPTMVKRNSDAGRLAQQRIDIELGILKPRAMEKEKRDSFGAEKPAARIEKSVDPDQW